MEMWVDFPTTRLAFGVTPLKVFVLADTGM